MDAMREYIEMPKIRVPISGFLGYRSNPAVKLSPGAIRDDV